MTSLEKFLAEAEEQRKKTLRVDPDKCHPYPMCFFNNLQTQKKMQKMLEVSKNFINVVRVSIVSSEVGPTRSLIKTSIAEEAMNQLNKIAEEE